MSMIIGRDLANISDYNSALFLRDRLLTSCCSAASDIGKGAVAGLGMILIQSSLVVLLPEQFDSRSLHSQIKRDCCKLLKVNEEDNALFLKRGLVMIGLIPAVAEETLFRYLVQEVLLSKSVDQKISKLFFGSDLVTLPSQVYPVVQLLVTSYLFARIHESNKRVLNEKYVNTQVKMCFIMGLVFGVTQKKWGLTAAISAHAVNNMLAVCELASIKAT